MTQNEFESKSNRKIFMDGSYIGILEAQNKAGKLKFEIRNSNFNWVEYSIVEFAPKSMSNLHTYLGIFCNYFR